MKIIAEICDKFGNDIVICENKSDYIFRLENIDINEIEEEFITITFDKDELIKIAKRIAELSKIDKVEVSNER